MRSGGCTMTSAAVSALQPTNPAEPRLFTKQPQSDNRDLADTTGIPFITPVQMPALLNNPKFTYKFS
jgi:hypothetical protein